MAYIRTETKNGVTYSLTQLAEKNIGLTWDELKEYFDKKVSQNTETFDQGIRVVVSESGQYVELVGVKRI